MFLMSGMLLDEGGREEGKRTIKRRSILLIGTSAGVALVCLGFVWSFGAPPTSEGASLLVQEEGGVPHSWISKKDLAVSRLQHGSDAFVKLPGQGILAASSKAPGQLLAYAPSASQVTPAAHDPLHAPANADGGERAVRDNASHGSKKQATHSGAGPKNEGLEQAKEQRPWQSKPSKQKLHEMVRKDEQDASILSKRHPRSVIGAHWRVAVSNQEELRRQLKAAQSAAAAAHLQEEKQLHDLKVSQAKREGVYAPKEALKAMGITAVAQAQHTTTDELHKGTSRTQPSSEKVPERYPAVSYFSRLRELGSRSTLGSRSGSHGPGMLYETDERRSEPAPRQAVYPGDTPSESGTEYEDRCDSVEEGKESDRIREAQRRLAEKWRRIMANPPPVREETRPDIVDRTTGSFPDVDKFLSKKREMKLFGAAVDGFESDPQFNPLTVMLAHSLTKYGVPPPETDDVGVWHDWYVEVKDRYHVLEQEVAALAQGRGANGGIDHGDSDHRRDRFNTVQRQILPVRPDSYARRIRREFTAEHERSSTGPVVMTLRIRHLGHRDNSRSLYNGSGSFRGDRSDEGRLSRDHVDLESDVKALLGRKLSGVRVGKRRDLRKIQVSLESIKDLLDSRRLHSTHDYGEGAAVGQEEVRRLHHYNVNDKETATDASHDRLSVLDWLRGAVKSA